MTKIVMSIRIEKELKHEAQRVAAMMGLSISTVIARYLQQFLEERSIHYRAISTAELDKLIAARRRQSLRDSLENIPGAWDRDI